MPMNDLLVLLDPESPDVGAFALSLASELGSHLTAALPVLRPTIPSYALAELPTDLLERVRREARAKSQVTIDAFRSDATAAGIVAEGLVVEGTLDGAGHKLAGLARHFDLSIVRQAGAQERADRGGLIEAMLFGAGRPLLVLPCVHMQPRKLETIVVAWDGGAQAARAVGDAMPFLQRARRVEVVSIGSGTPEADFPGFNITRHLARNGVTAELQVLSRVGSVADTILSRAADAEADLLVMGGYGHSRLREVVLGGATRTVLATATLPVLMSH